MAKGTWNRNVYTPYDQGNKAAIDSGIGCFLAYAVTFGAVIALLCWLRSVGLMG